MESYQYEQTRSFNVGIAQEVSVEAALIYDDLAYAQRNFGNGWFYRSHEMLEKRLPFISKSTIQRNIKKLAAAGYIRTKTMKVDGIPVCHFQIDQFLLVKLTNSMDSVKLTKSIYNNYKTTIKDPDVSFGAEKENTGVVICTFHKKTGKPGANCRECHTNQRSTNERELIAIVNRVTGRNFRTLGSRGVKKTLNAFTLEEIEGALTALVADDWHKSKIKDLSIEYFTRATTIDRFVEQGRSMQPQQQIDRAAQKRLDWIEEQEELDAFRNDRRREYWEAKKSPETLAAYREKYGLTYHAD